MVMGADDKVLITLSGEGPWGFRLHGGSEKNLPLQVSKIRKRSKACRGGLWENDELVSINGKPCVDLSHAEAMQIIDSSGGHLKIWVKRSAVRDGRSPSPGNQRQLRVLQSTSSPNPGQDPRSPEPPPRLRHRGSLTSPPDSEAYYGETDSDADIRASIPASQHEPPELPPSQLPPEKHRRTRKKSPRSPPSAEPQQPPQSLSEMSSQNSVPDPEGTSVQVPWRTGSGAGEGVAKREISRADAPFSDTEMPAELEPEAEPSSPSPEALLLPHGVKNIRAERHLIPMVGPVEHPVDEDLTTTYTEKAKQASQTRLPNTVMPLSGTPAPNKRKKSTKLIMEINPSREGEYEVSKLNLGKKISTPRDIMLEELSLLNNKGSKMFKLRQKRVEKFIYENNPDVFADNSVDRFQKFIPSVGGQLGGGVGYGLPYGRGQFASGMMGSYGYGQHQHPSAPGFKHGSESAVGGSAGGAGQAGGPGGGGAQTGGSGSTGGTGGHDQKAGGGGKQVTVYKTYISPWEKAMGINTHQPANLNIDLLAFDPKGDLLNYKSFNRSAMPYGGYEKASKLMTFQMPEIDRVHLEPVSVIVYDQGISNRPTFNRTPVPWLGSGEMNHLNVELNVPMDGETEEL